MKMRVAVVLAAMFSAFSVVAADPKADWALKIEHAVAELTPQVKPEKPRKLLVYTRASGFVHSSIPIGAKCFEILGQKTGAFEVTKVTDDPAIFSDENLKDFDAILLMSTTSDFNLPRV